MSERTKPAKAGTLCARLMAYFTKSNLPQKTTASHSTRSGVPLTQPTPPIKEDNNSNNVLGRIGQYFKVKVPPPTYLSQPTPGLTTYVPPPYVPPSNVPSRRVPSARVSQNTALEHHTAADGQVTRSEPGNQSIPQLSVEQRKASRLVSEARLKQVNNRVNSQAEVASKCSNAAGTRQVNQKRSKTSGTDSGTPLPRPAKYDPGFTNDNGNRNDMPELSRVHGNIILFVENLLKVKDVQGFLRRSRLLAEKRESKTSFSHGKLGDNNVEQQLKKTMKGLLKKFTMKIGNGISRSNAERTDDTLAAKNNNEINKQQTQKWTVRFAENLTKPVLTDRQVSRISPKVVAQSQQPLMAKREQAKSNTTKIGVTAPKLGPFYGKMAQSNAAEHAKQVLENFFKKSTIQINKNKPAVAATSSTSQGTRKATQSLPPVKGQTMPTHSGIIQHQRFPTKEEYRRAMISMDGRTQQPPAGAGIHGTVAGKDQSTILDESVHPEFNSTLIDSEEYENFDESIIGRESITEDSSMLYDVGEDDLTQLSEFDESVYDSGVCGGAIIPVDGPTHQMPVGPGLDGTIVDEDQMSTVLDESVDPEFNSTLFDSEEYEDFDESAIGRESLTEDSGMLYDVGEDDLTQLTEFDERVCESGVCGRTTASVDGPTHQVPVDPGLDVTNADEDQMNTVLDESFHPHCCSTPIDSDEFVNLDETAMGRESLTEDNSTLYDVDENYLSQLTEFDESKQVSLHEKENTFGDDCGRVDYISDESDDEVEMMKNGAQTLERPDCIPSSFDASGSHFDDGSRDDTLMDNGLDDSGYDYGTSDAED